MAYKDKRPSWFMTREVAEAVVDVCDINPDNVEEVKIEAQRRRRTCNEDVCPQGRFAQCNKDLGALLTMAKQPALSDDDEQLLSLYHQETIGCCDGMHCWALKAQANAATLVANYYDPAAQQSDDSLVQEAMST